MPGADRAIAARHARSTDGNGSGLAGAGAIGIEGEVGFDHACLNKGLTAPMALYRAYKVDFNRHQSPIEFEADSDPAATSADTAAPANPAAANPAATDAAAAAAAPEPSL